MGRREEDLRQGVKRPLICWGHNFLSGRVHSWKTKNDWLMRCQLKTHYLLHPVVSLFSILSLKSFAPQGLTPPIPWNLLRDVTGLVTVSLCPVLLPPALPGSLSGSFSCCQSHLLVFCYIHVFGNTIWPVTLIITYVWMNPKSLPLLLQPSTLLWSLPSSVLSLSLSFLCKISHLSLTFCLHPWQDSEALIHPVPGLREASPTRVLHSHWTLLSECCLN